MSALTRMLHKFAVDQGGATAIEYGLIISLIFLAILASVESVASAATAMFNLVATAMT